MIGAALDACTAWSALGGEVRDGTHARFVRNEPFADVPGTNRVSHVTASSPTEIDELLADVARAFAGAAAPVFDIDHRTPPAFEARLVLEGYERRDSLVMLLEGDLHTETDRDRLRSPDVDPIEMERGRPRPLLVGAEAALDIREITTEDDWGAWEALSIGDNLGYPVRPGVAADRTQAAALTASRRAKCPPVRYFMAYAAGEAVGFFSSWEGAGGLGVTENLSVEEHARGRGIATALVHACVADARAHGARAIALTCNPNDWPKWWYARLGFRPVAVKRTYSAPG